jgi:hypothetical protein
VNSLTPAAITRINPSHGPDESTFITLWNHGLETAEIARCLGIKETMAQSRAYRLQQRGLIQSRPRGGDLDGDLALLLRPEPQFPRPPGRPSP